MDGFTMTSHPSPPAEAKRILSVRDALAALWRGRLLILLSSVVLGMLAYGVAWLLPERYTGEGMVAVATQRFAIPELQGALSGETPPDPLPGVRSETQILQSPQLIQGAIEDLKLDQNSEWNPMLRPSSVLHEIANAIRDALPGWLPDVPEATPAAIRQIVREEVEKRLSVTHDNRSLIIAVTFKSEDPAIASGFVNALMRRYLAMRDAAGVDTNRDGNKTISTRIAEVKGELDALEARTRALRKSSGLVDLRAGSEVQQRVEDLAIALSRATVDRSQAEANWQRAQTLGLRGAGDAMVEALGSQTMSRLRDREAEAGQKLTSLSEMYGPQHPDYIRAQTELRTVRAEIANEVSRVRGSLQAAVAATRQQETATRREFEAARAAASRTSQVQAELNRLEKESQARWTLYNALLESEQRTINDARTGAGGAGDPGVRVASWAVEPGLPSSIKPKLAGAIGLLGGFMFGAMLAVARGPARKGFAAAGDVANETGLRTFAVMPPVRRRDRWMSLPTRVLAHPGGPEAENLRILRSRLAGSARATGFRSVVFCQAGLGTQAASMAAAFARVAAQEGSRVLLIEGNLRTPSMVGLLSPGPVGSLHSVYGEENVPWQAALENDPAVAGLDLLLMGEGALPPWSITPRLKAMLAEAQAEYDLVVLDAPSADTASEPLALAGMVTATVLVLGAGGTGHDAAREAAERLRGAAVNDVAAILDHSC